MREIYGIEAETVEHETIVVHGTKDVPPWWDEQEKLREDLGIKCFIPLASVIEGGTKERDGKSHF